MINIRETWYGWQRNLICMWANQLLVCLGFSAAFSFIPLYIGSGNFGALSEAEVAYWTSHFAFFGMLAYAVFTPLWGVLGDRWGVKLMLYRGSFVTALIYPFLGLTHDLHVLMALRFATGALSGTTVAAQMLIVKTTPNDRQGYALGVLGTAIWGGYMIGEMLGGTVAHFFGFRAAFFLCGALFFTSGLFVIFARDSERSIDVRVGAGGRPGFRERRGNIRWLFAPAILMMLFLFLLSGLVQRFNAPYTPMMVKRIAGADKAALWTGLIGMFAAGGSMISGVVLGTLSDKHAEWKLTTPMQLLSAAMLFFASGAKTLFGFGFCHAANSFAVGGLHAVFQKVTSGLVDRSRRGTVLGFATTLYNVGYMLATLLSGWVIARFGLSWGYRSASMLMLVLAATSCVVIFNVLRIKERKRKNAAESAGCK
jgi:MFS family permease